MNKVVKKTTKKTSMMKSKKTATPKKSGMAKPKKTATKAKGMMKSRPATKVSKK